MYIIISSHLATVLCIDAVQRLPRHRQILVRIIGHF
jgi:hypothetical protein